MRDDHEIRDDFAYVAKAYEDTNAAVKMFRTAYMKAVNRLLHEAMASRWTVDQIARGLRLPPARVRVLLRRLGYEPRAGKGALEERAASFIRANAEVFGVSVKKFDLTSPLAYLPMGKALADELNNRRVADVHEIPEVTDEMVEAFKSAWHAADRRAETGHRVRTGLIAALAVRDAG